MKNRFADRMGNVKRSFIREILKVTSDPKIISFAGGLPNPSTFQVDEIGVATRKVLKEDGANVLQYSTTEGYLPLRKYIAERYLKCKGISVDADEILITNGSQQGLDLISKVFLNKGDDVLIERPGYLGAIQAISMFEPHFHSVGLSENGVDINELEAIMENCDPKFFYAVPNFQNPSGLTYSAENRRKVAEILKNRDTIFIEDDPYGELRFLGENMPSMKTFFNEGTILLGSFSKIVSPGMRIGWICANHEIMEKLVVAKQAADLQSNYFSQRVMYQYLADNDINSHIESIAKLYKNQCDCMTANIQKYFPSQIKCTKPEGGMFMWVTLPDDMSSLELFDIAAKENVAFVPGDPFYLSETGTNTLRLNYTNSDEKTIEEGIRRLAGAIERLMVYTNSN
jgi:2-aminoadipate transaminase